MKRIKYKAALIPWLCHTRLWDQSYESIIPLGILSLTGGLTKKGYDVCFIDPNLHSKDIINKLCNVDVDIYGFSIAAGVLDKSASVAQEIKRLRPEARILFGGPLATLSDIELMECFPFVDFVLRGEAEETICQLIENLEVTGRLQDVPGLTYRENSNLNRNPNARLITDLDSLPFPSLDLYPLCFKPKSVIPIEIGRGCDGRCGFCSSWKIGGHLIRRKSVARIVEEIDRIIKLFGKRYLYFRHDQIETDPAWLYQLCQALRRKGDISWQCSCRIDRVTPEMLEEMASAGCQLIEYGIESGSPIIQKKIHKRLDVDSVVPILKHAARIGIESATYFMSGYPGESEEDFKATIRLISNCIKASRGRLFLQMRKVIPFPATSLTKTYSDAIIPNQCGEMLPSLVFDALPPIAYTGLFEKALFPERYSFETVCDSHKQELFEKFTSSILQPSARYFPRTIHLILRLVEYDLNKIFNLWQNALECTIPLHTKSFRESIVSVATILKQIAANIETTPPCVCDIIEYETQASDLSNSYRKATNNIVADKPKMANQVALITTRFNICSCQMGGLYLLSGCPCTPSINGLLLVAQDYSQCNTYSISIQAMSVLRCCSGKYQKSDIPSETGLPEDVVAEILDEFHSMGLIDL